MADASPSHKVSPLQLERGTPCSTPVTGNYSRMIFLPLKVNLVSISSDSSEFQEA